MKIVDSKKEKGGSVKAKEEEDDDDIAEQQEMVEKVEKLLKILYNFEESSAEAISGMLVECLGGNNVQGGVFALRLISHIELLVNALQRAEIKKSEITKISNNSYPKEAKLIAKKIPQFFDQLRNHSSSLDKAESTRVMIQMVSDIANVLKFVMRKILTAGLYLEHNYGFPDLFTDFLHELDKFHDDDSIQTSHMVGFKDEKCDSCLEILGKEKDLKLERNENGFVYLVCNLCQGELTPKSNSLECSLHNSTTSAVFSPQLFIFN